MAYIPFAESELLHDFPAISSKCHLWTTTYSTILSSAWASSVLALELIIAMLKNSVPYNWGPRFHPPFGGKLRYGGLEPHPHFHHILRAADMMVTRFVRYSGRLARNGWAFSGPVRIPLQPPDLICFGSPHSLPPQSNEEVRSGFSMVGWELGELFIRSLCWLKLVQNF